MNNLTYKERIVKSIKWFLLWGILITFFNPEVDSTQPEISRVIILSIPFYIATYRILYEKVEDFFNGIRYIFIPNIISFIFGKYDADVDASLKLFIWAVISIVETAYVANYHSQLFRIFFSDV
jgi:hypothetical protein